MLQTMTIAATLLASTGSKPEISFDIWDWTTPCRDIDLFTHWVNDLAHMGFNRIEFSVPWREVEPEPGRYDLSWLEKRLAVCKEAGVGVRLRINSYYAGAVPDWYDGDLWTNEKGDVLSSRIPSITDDRFWTHYGEMCRRIAVLCRGEDVYHNAFIGVHAELKWSGWNTYDASTLRRWRKVICRPRPDWLRKVVADDAELPDIPPVLAATKGIPEMDPSLRALFAFREQCWREAIQRFNTYIRQGDPDARISSPLGESFRKESAEIANQDYWGLSRGSDQIVHSYDFFWHTTDGTWMAAAAVASFRGITGLPVVFEFDGPRATIDDPYSHAQLLSLGQQAQRAGAGLKIANFSYASHDDPLPSENTYLQNLVQLWKQDWAVETQASHQDTVLLFVSKWANYAYRESTQWLHEAQFGVYKMLTDISIPVRIICEDNLDEDLSEYRALYAAFSPRSLMTASDVQKLDQLSIPIIEDMPIVPPLRSSAKPLPAQGIAQVRVTHPYCPTSPLDLSELGSEYDYSLRSDTIRLAAYRPGHVILGYPIGLLYIRDDQPSEHEGVMVWALMQALSTQ